MTIEELKRPERLDEDRIEALKALFPEAFPDGRFDVQTLSELLESPANSSTSSDRHYGLEWPGKKESRKHAVSPANKTLVPLIGEGFNEEVTSNLIIEGDNLDVMKSILKAYAGRVKLIYIDPPYNTGNDFIYRDNFRQETDTYLQHTNQKDIDGLLVTNPRATGRFHANWLNMIYPRLKLAHSLLADGGSIFISIDDNEYGNLRAVCDEVFGEENFISSICWQKKYTVSNDTVDFSRSHEYILVYSKLKTYSENGSLTATLNGLPRTEENNKAYRNTDNDPKGKWRANPYVCNKSADERPALYYPITNPNTGEQIFPSKHAVWRFSKESHEKNVANGRVYWGIDGSNRTPAFKRYLSEVGTVVSDTWWDYKEVGHTDEAKREIKELFPDAPDAFDTPKPTRLISKIIEIASSPDNCDIILDFFAGSGTTAHSVMLANASDGGNRSFILVQAPEKISEGREVAKIGMKNISEVTSERVRRASLLISKKLAKDVKIDLGFRRYRLSSSNIRKYQPRMAGNLTELQGLDFTGASSLQPSYKTQDVLAELMLLEGFPLDSHVEQAPEFDDVVQVVTHPERSYRLLICLSTDTLLDETVDAAKRYPKDTFVCLESSLTDELKIRLADAVENIKTL